MLFRQNIWIQVALTLLGVLLVWWLGSERVEAGIIGEETFEYDGVEYTYYLMDLNGFTYYQSSSTYYYVMRPDTILYCFPFRTTAGTNDGYVYFYSMDSFNIIRDTYKQSNSTLHSTTTYTSYLHDVGCSYYNVYTTFKDPDITFNICSKSVASAFASYFVSDDFKDIKSKKFDYEYPYDKPYYLSYFNTSVSDDTLSASWGRLNRLSISDYDNSFIRFSFILLPRDSDSANMPILKKWDSTYKINEFSAEFSLSEIGVDDTYYLYKVMATPYFYEEDDTEKTLYSCYTSSVYFDVEGNQTDSDITDSDVAEDLPEEEEDASKSILERITDFFGSFFVKFADMLKELFIPSSDELQDLLDRVQLWFTDRFGFLWFPFSLAIEIVENFAFGEACSILTIPAFNLNLGSVGTFTLWNEFTVDFDTMGIFEYVRFFNSCVMACCVLGLAIDKFDEWIGGHVKANGGGDWYK